MGMDEDQRGDHHNCTSLLLLSYNEYNFVILPSRSLVSCGILQFTSSLTFSSL